MKRKFQIAQTVNRAYRVIREEVVNNESKKKKSNKNKKLINILIVVLFTLSMFGCAGMTPNSYQTSYQTSQPQMSNAVKSAGVGALLGGIAHAIIGGDTQQGLAIVGGTALAGYLFGNEKDKQIQQVNTYQQQRQQQYNSNKGQTVWNKKIERVTVNGKTEERISETGVSTKTEGSYYE